MMVKIEIFRVECKNGIGTELERKEETVLKLNETMIETPIKKVYLAQIQYPFENGDFTPIGIYSSRENAQNAIDKKIDSSTYDKSMLSSDIDEYILDQE